MVADEIAQARVLTAEAAEAGGVAPARPLRSGCGSRAGRRRPERERGAEQTGSSPVFPAAPPVPELFISVTGIVRPSARLVNPRAELSMDLIEDDE